MAVMRLLGSNSSLESHEELDLSVEHKHQGGSHSAESVSSGTLEESGGALLLHDLEEAIHSSLIDPLRSRLLGLHLETTTDGVKRVRSITGSDGSSLGNAELGEDSKDVAVVAEGVDSSKRVVHTEVDSTVRDDTSDGHTETVVETHDSTGTLGSLHKAVTEAVEGLGTRSDIRGKTGTGIVERVHNAERTGTGKTSRGHVGKEEHTELGLGAVLGKEGLDGVLESEVKGLGREVTDDVGEVSTPESLDSLLASDAGEAVSNAGVTGNLARLDERVGILSLDDQLDTLDRSSGSLSDGTRDTTSGKIRGEVENTCVLVVCHCPLVSPK